MQAFIAAYATLRYECCDDGEPEPGYEKVVIYVKDGSPTHAARQLANGKWTSKLGAHIDVEHPTPTSLVVELPNLFPEYGLPAQYLRRPRRSVSAIS